MNIESYRQYCLQKKGVTENFPFDEEVLVFRVGEKIFALCNINAFESINLKCEPEAAIEWREKYEGILPGFHMNKKHWNTVRVNQDVPVSVVKHLIDHSYELVLLSLTKKLQAEISSLE